MYLEAVREDGNALQWVPDEIKTAELCLEAVKQDRFMIQYVPEELREEVRRRLENGE
jgi:hypothetical protein